MTIKRVFKNCAQFHELPKNLLTLNYISAQNKKLAHKIINFAHTLIFTYYSGDDRSEEIKPTLGIGEKEVVFVTHDECMCYANDGE